VLRKPFSEVLQKSLEAGLPPWCRADAFMGRERADWESATLAFDERPDVARSDLTLVSLPKPVAVAAPSYELHALLDGMRSHAQFGRKPRYATWRVARAKPDVRTAYHS
jgi:hypothetical protein